MATVVVAKVRWEGLGFGGERQGGNEYNLSLWFQGLSPGTVPSWRLLEAAAFVEVPAEGGHGSKQATLSEASMPSQMF